MIIFSVYRTDRSDEANAMCQLETLKYLRRHNVPVELGQGVYKGDSEPCIKVGYYYRRHAAQLCSVFGQECYLVVDHSGTATLVNADSTLTPVGTWSEVPDRPTGDHTELGGKFYVCT